MYTYDWIIQQVKVQHLSDCDVKKCSATGNRTPVSRVTGGDTHHYTIVESFAYVPMSIFQKRYQTSDA